MRPLLRALLTCPPGQFLPDDPRARWGGRAGVLDVPGITVEDGGLFLPATTARGDRALTLVSACPSSALMQQARETALVTRAALHTTVDLGPGSTERIVFLGSLPAGAPDPSVRPFTPADSAAFQALAADPTLDGFRFLSQRLQTDTAPGVTLCAVDGTTILGAMGPLAVAPDPWGVPWLLPAYFGVRSDARRTGIGTRLWRAAMAWASAHGARYALVQNRAGTPASQFYLRAGLTPAHRSWALAPDRM